ncbi:sensor histidine kinase [Phycicoccus sonneratiae]|uniref:Signal transduction histidine kinase subgroup 3 dimerisation and phosphoacceptor domain-containing protein n=1 Tax=Phycicoccus sonneratiae TaxID=2807628 RepID=A0ABS2CP48_9MICO|nr:histidine kinase [Phycicoccus sonneraticus]MBM6401203.1 hypothetical protein [Phycicoccus sonneraticus]
MRVRGSADARIAVVASWAVVLVVLVQGTLSMLTQVSTELGPVQRGVGVVGGLVGAGFFLLVQRRTLRDAAVPGWVPWVTVLAAGAAFVAGAWLAAALVFGTVGLLLSGRRLAAAGVGFTVALGAFMLREGVNPFLASFLLVVVAAIGLLLYVLTRLALVVAELARARETVARLRVDEERHRISRDLHDVLGRTLVAVGLRVQTASRLLDRDPARCREQLDEVTRMVGEGRSQLRGLTGGGSVTGFQDELDAARDILERLGVRCSVDTGAAAAPAALDGLGARVLRECVTNVLKHARASWVEVGVHEEAGAVVLVVVNDGASASAGHRGTGLADLAARASAAGGALEAGHEPSGRFRVRCRVPASVPAPAHDAAGAPA